MFGCDRAHQNNYLKESFTIRSQKSSSLFVCNQCILIYIYIFNMYILLFLCALCVTVIGKPCRTPSGQQGKCLPIRSCPSLLWSFTNPKYVVEEYLLTLACSNDEFGLVVCCQTPSDFLVFEDEEDNYNLNDVTNVKLVNNKNCGVSSTLMTHNGDIRVQDFPWLVKIMTVDNNLPHQDRVENIACTGVLISHLYVLYSAQCHYSVVGDLSFFIRINIYTGKEAGCSKASYSPHCNFFRNYEIDATIVHPFYDPQTKLNDLVIMKLSRRFIYLDYFQPICLPIYSEPLKTGQTLQTAGWTRTYTLDDFSTKTTQSSTLISNLDCKERLVKNGRNITLSSYEICTYSKQNSVTKDQIGLPLMSLHGNQWYLQGFETQGENTKVYTRIQNYLQWIQGVLGGERCLTPYNQTGECMHLTDCPKLMDAFANPSPSDEKNLRSFICEYPEPNDGAYILKVCCNFEPDFIIPPETNNNSLDFQVSNFRYCGLQHRDDYFSEDDRISVDEFPWLAVIVNANETKGTICGGTLITERYVITSGQCSYWFNTKDEMLVRLGNYNIKNSSYCSEVAIGLYDCTDTQEYKIEEEIIHPFYNKFTFVNDIALLRLNEKVTFTDYVRPICLPRSTDDLPQPGTTLFTTGFGNRPYGSGVEIKKKIQTRLILNDKCQEILIWHRYIQPVTHYQICTKDSRNSTDITCFGDEGGPVMFSTKLRWFIQGISSSFDCSGNSPQTHINVFKYIKWIKLNIKN